MLKKNLLSLILALCLCMALAAPAWAADEITQPFSVSEIQSYFADEQILDNNVEFVENGIEKTVTSHNVMTLAENQPPVAELQVVVLNPESMINGNFTTETQLAWLWSYNGENFTYDPDGDAIADMRIGGISNSDIIGTVGEIGFATQFQEAGQYVLTFQVQDTNGAWSNIAQYAFIIEPADGNTRPVCKIGYSSDNVLAGSPLVISWANSIDPDPDDYIDKIGGIVIKDDVTTPLTDYIVLSESDYCALSFNEPGQYEIWFHIADNHNAWSNWVIFTVTVDVADLQEVKVYGVYEPTSTDAWWVDNDRAKTYDAEPSWEEAEYLAEQCGSHNFPSSLPKKIVGASDFSVSGKLVSETGEPLANVPVHITMTLVSDIKIDKFVYTNSNGEFSYRPGATQFWLDTGLYPDKNAIDHLAVGTSRTHFIRYSRYTGTNYLAATTVKIEAGGDTYSEKVTCIVGYRKNPTIGNLYYTGSIWAKW